MGRDSQIFDRQLARSGSAEGAALCPSDMMLCVISYWVLSGAPQAADSTAKLLRTHPTKTLKWRDVYLKLTRHNGRAGKHGTYNPKHNDRNFDLTNSEHIDPERAKGNIYWDCFHGFRSALDPQDPDNLAATFSEVERQFYESRYSNFVESQNARNAKIRHTERNRTIEDLLEGKKTCPEETIYQLGTLDEHASSEDLMNIVTEFIGEFKAKYGERVHVLDWALHLDESTPHIHERHVFDCENKYGEVSPQQEKALEALGFDLPDPGKPLSRRNNRAHFWNFANSDLAPEFLNEPQELGLPVRGLFYGEEGFRHFFTVKPVAAIGDLKGMKLRVSNDPVMNGMVEGLGANPTVVAFGELYSALQTGVVDGAEQPIANYKSNAFPEVANNLILDGHTLGAVQAVITDNAWGKLTANQQAAVMAAAADTQKFNADLSETAENKVLEELRSSGCNVVDVDDKTPWQEACAKVIKDNTSDQAELYQKLLDMKA